MTIEALEQLANEICETETDRRAKLQRMIRAYCRIIAFRDEDSFKRLKTRLADEDGHWDSSYPPDQQYKMATGPRAKMIQGIEVGSRATSGGFYHDLEYYTENPGYYVGREGEWYESSITGTGRFGQFAAYPGECNVDCEIEYDRTDDVPTSVLVEAEEELRELAFPLATAATVC